MVKTIQVSDEFHSYLASHGKFKDTMEHILIRLIGLDTPDTATKMKSFTGDKDTKIYSKKDINSRTTNKKRGEK